MNKEYLKKLARLAVEGGVNVQKGQTVVIDGDIQTAVLIREIVSAAYDAGAMECIVRYSDEIVSHENRLRASEESFHKPEKWLAALHNDTAQAGACYIHVLGSDPDLMKDTDPARTTAAAIAITKEIGPYMECLQQGKLATTVLACPTLPWAKKVYPELEEQEALEQLWEDVFSMSRVDENDPMDNWKTHSESFAARIKALNEAGFQKLHYQNSAGTDLWVTLPDRYSFIGGGSVLKDGRLIYNNIPTEEIFGSPDFREVNGRLAATMPLNCHGSLVEDFWFEFKDGKVVDFDAAKGKEVLEKLLDTDEGAKSLGELAFVSWGSPIQKKNRIYYNTLIDENASCHFALGQSFSDSIENGQNLSSEELTELGLNQSAVHMDFMVGSQDLSITGYTKDGREVLVFVNGCFSDLF